MNSREIVKHQTDSLSPFFSPLFIKQSLDDPKCTSITTSIHNILMKSIWRHRMKMSKQTLALSLVERRYAATSTSSIPDWL